MNNPSTSARPSAAARLPGVAVAVAGAAALVAVAFAWNSRGERPAASQVTNAASASLAAPTPRPRVQLALLHAERFTVRAPFQHLWRADQPWVTTGWLLVVSGDPELLRPRQAKEPVLYVGAQTAERINHAASGRLVLLVPGDFPLAAAPIFLGDVALPEELRQPQIDAQLAGAVAAGAIATPAETIAKVTVAGAREFATDFELRQRAIDLVEIHSPEEKDLIAGWRVPRVR